jgi:hypothetical protein
MATLDLVTTSIRSAAPARWLAFDTSTDTMAVAAGHGDRVAAVDVPGGALASARLIDTAIAQLAAVGLSLRELDVVGCARLVRWPRALRWARPFRCCRSTAC